MFEFSSAHRSLNQAEAVEIFELHQMAQDFRYETADREAHERYCRWYSQVAEQHRQELAAMQRMAQQRAQFWQPWSR